MTTDQIKQAYLDFFKTKNHSIIPPAPLIPQNDPSTLFTSAGMQQLVPYLKGEPHPMGNRLANTQPCFRAEDIDQVGDNRHTTYFEMLGNWSLGDYFKKEQLLWIWQFYTQILGLDKSKLYVTVYQGSPAAPKDTQSAAIWKSIGVPEERIFFYPDNWWSRSGSPDKMPPGEIGGPDSEIFFEFTQIKHDSKFGKKCHPNCECGRFLEIGNSVFLQYEKQTDGFFKPLPNQNVDFGGGLERIAAAVQNSPDVFQIDVISPIIKAIEKSSSQKYGTDTAPAMRVIADHLRAAAFMIAQDIEPSNKTQGYILRRLLRRSAVKMHELGGGLAPTSLRNICSQVVKQYPLVFNKNQGSQKINNTVEQEMNKFNSSLDRGLKELKKLSLNQFNELSAFNLFQTYGFPFEVSAELFKKKGKILNKKEFDKIFEQHKKLSQTASAGMFKSGLENQSAATAKLHTATHLLHQALRTILGTHVKQEGSHITAERLRFDFTHNKPLSPVQLKKIEALINQKIKQNLPVTKSIQSKTKALQSGALAFFKQTYPDKVSIYTIGDFSREICHGPHVASTGEIGSVRIIKLDTVGAGKRRIYIGFKNGTQKPAQ